MNIKFIDDFTFNVYIKKEKLGKLNIKSKEEVESYLKNIIINLKTNYGLKVEGFYDVNIYIDKYYGMILNFNKERLDYYDYYNGVDLNINIEEATFLYKVDDILMCLSSKFKIELVDNNVYIKIIDELNQKEFINLMEHTEKIVKI